MPIRTAAEVALGSAPISRPRGRGAIGSASGSWSGSAAHRVGWRLTPRRTAKIAFLIRHYLHESMNHIGVFAS